MSGPITTESVLDSIADSFRQYGFEGASLTKISESTGLIKASLYHRYPGGKGEMAEAVLSHIDRHFAEYVLQPIDEPGDPSDRLAKVARRLREFYRAGTRSCLLNTLTLSGGPPSIRAHTRKTLAFWLSKFARLAEETGLDAGEARLRAEDAVAALEGGLILVRITGSRQPFLRALDSLGRHLNV